MVSHTKVSVSMVLSIIFAMQALCAFGQSATATLTDIDGNVYKTVKIGSQVWMAENLKVSRYRNGEAIATAKKNEAWEALTTGAWSFYDNDSAKLKKYGGLYNWYAATDPRGLCPSGWHVPSDAEFYTLAQTLGGDSVAGKKLMASNGAGFRAPAAGYRFFNGKYNHMDNFTGFWSATEANSVFGWPRFLNFKDDPELHRVFFGKKNGLSCRCIKD